MIFIVAIVMFNFVCFANAEAVIPYEELLTLPDIKIKNITARQEQPNRQCTCDLGLCSCCSGYFLDLINQKACLRVRYKPDDFAFDVSMAMNDNVLYENTLSGKNPRPICVSPPRFPNVKVCAKFSNVFFPGRNFHFCASMLGRWGQLELFDISFDCMRIGAQGIAMVKPEDGGGLHIVNPAGGVDAEIDAAPNDEEIEEYDENVIKSLLDEIY